MNAAAPEDTRTTITNCDREPIHIPGAILPHGAMLVLDEDTFEILQLAGDVTGNGTLSLLGANSYTGITTVAAGGLTANTLANGGLPSSVGASPSDASNLVLAGALKYTGANITTDRGYTVANNASIDTANNITFGGAIASTNGTFTKLGAGTITYTNSGASVYNTSGGPSYLVSNGRVVFDGGPTQVNTVHGELVTGNSTNAVSVEVKSGTTNIETWLSVGRGNGTTGLSSSFTVSGNAVVNAAQSSMGYDAGVAAYSANPVLNVKGGSVQLDKPNPCRRIERFQCHRQHRRQSWRHGRVPNRRTNANRLGGNRCGEREERRQAPDRRLAGRRRG